MRGKPVFATGAKRGMEGGQGGQGGETQLVASCGMAEGGQSTEGRRALLTGITGQVGGAVYWDKGEQVPT